MRPLSLFLFVVLWVSAGELAAQPQLTLEATISLDLFPSSDCETCLVRFSESEAFMYILHADQHTLWQYTREGELVQKLDLLTLPIEPQVPVKPKVRITDFAVLEDDLLLLAEMNTGSLYKIDTRGQIQQHIQLENSPQGLLLIAPDLVAVYYQVFSEQYVSLFTLTGTERHKAALGSASNLSKQPGGLLLSFGPVMHVQNQDGSFFLLPSAGSSVFQCQPTPAGLSCTRLLESEHAIQQIGYAPATATFWYTTEDEATSAQTYHAFDVRSNKPLGTGAVPAFLQHGGFQYLDRYYTLHDQTLRGYTYE